VSEIRYALRSLIKRPGPTLVVVATLGVAIASATVIYSVVDVVWHFIPAVNQDRLVYVARLTHVWCRRRRQPQRRAANPRLGP
jgi:hypothetical protein